MALHKATFSFSEVSQDCSSIIGKSRLWTSCHLLHFIIVRKSWTTFTLPHSSTIFFHFDHLRWIVEAHVRKYSYRRFQKSVLSNWAMKCLITLLRFSWRNRSKVSHCVIVYSPHCYPTYIFCATQITEKKFPKTNEEQALIISWRSKVYLKGTQKSMLIICCSDRSPLNFDWKVTCLSKTRMNNHALGGKLY